MNYFKITKNGVLVGIGNSDSNIPKNDSVFKYVSITEKEYNKLEKIEFISKNNKTNE